MHSGTGPLVPLQGAALGYYNESGARMRFGVGMLVPLQGVVAGCHCCRILFRSSRRYSPWPVVAKKRFVLTKHKFCLASDQRSELGSLRYDSGIIRA